MAIARYPNDANFNPLLIPALSRINYTGNGVRTSFNLSEPAEKVGEVIAVIDGIPQSTDKYSLSNVNTLNSELKNTITFDDPPTASTQVELRVIRIPRNFEILREFPDVKTITYTGSNVTINSNSYSIDGSQLNFALPRNSSIAAKDDILVSIDGITQNSSEFTYPSPVLGSQGIKIGSDAAGTIPYSNVASNPSGGVEAISITTFNKTSSISRLESMADKKPDRSGISIQKAFHYNKFESQAGYEKRRLVSRRGKRGYKLKYTNITGIEKSAIEEFYNARSGNFEAFLFELTHINEPGTVTVRFDSPLKIIQVLSTGTNPIDNFYTIDFDLVEVFD